MGKPIRASHKHSLKDLAKVLSLMVLDKSADEISDDVGAPVKQVREMMQIVLADEEVRIIGRRREEVFADYSLQSRGMMKQLDELLHELRATKQGNAAVGAIVAKHKIMDRVIERGQEFGFIDKKPAQHMVLVAKLDDSALAELVNSELTAMRALLSTGGTPLLEVALPGSAPLSTRPLEAAPASSAAPIVRVASRPADAKPLVKVAKPAVVHEAEMLKESSDVVVPLAPARPTVVRTRFV